MNSDVGGGTGPGRGRAEEEERAYETAQQTKRCRNGSLDGWMDGRMRDAMCRPLRFGENIEEATYFCLSNFISSPVRSSINLGPVRTYRQGLWAAKKGE